MRSHSDVEQQNYYLKRLYFASVYIDKGGLKRKKEEITISK